MEGAGVWKDERERPYQSSTTARPAHRIISTDWLGLQSPNLLHKHAEVATKNWALRRDCAGLTGVITRTRIVGRMLGISGMHCWQLEWHDTPADRLADGD
jgi:hypothetical protein